MKTKQYAVVAVCAAAAALVLCSTALAGPKKTYFTIVENPVPTPPVGQVFIDGPQMFMVGVQSAYQEIATDPRLTGPKAITFDAVFDLPAMTGRMWGTSHKEHPDGAWDGYWTGTRTVFTDPDGTPHVRSTIVSMAEGSGAFEGLVVRWDITAVDAAPGTPMTGSGYIIEAKGGPGERPMQSRGEGTERVETRGAMVTIEILSEVSQPSHVGRPTNQGFGLLNPLTGEVSMSGVLTSPDGDKLYWVATGWSLGPVGPADLTLHWVGGTGRFEAAVGAIRGLFELGTTEDPSMLYYSFDTKGTIRY